MEKRELVALLNLSSWCLLMVQQLFLAVPRGCLRFVIVVFPDHTHLLFLIYLVMQNTDYSICGSPHMNYGFFTSLGEKNSIVTKTILTNSIYSLPL